MFGWQWRQSLVTPPDTFDSIIGLHTNKFTNAQSSHQKQDFNMAANGAIIQEPACINDIEALAQQNLSRFAFDYFAGGSSMEQTIQDNVMTYKR